MRFYLAEPIDDAAGYDEAHGLAVANEIAGLWPVSGKPTIFRPRIYWRNRAGTPADEVMARNEEERQSADAVIGVLPAGVASVGVPIELYQSSTDGRPVMSYCPGGSKSVMLRMLGPVTTSLLEARAWLMKRAILDGRPQEDEVLQLQVAGAGLVHPHYPGDCGIDLPIAQDLLIAQGGSANVPCGVSVALPEGTFGWITARSSTWTEHGLIVLPGIIDQGWRGEIRVLVFNPVQVRDGEVRATSLRIKAGTRLAQLVVLPNLMGRVRLEQVEALPESERGSHGFGSTGL